MATAATNSINITNLPRAEATALRTRAKRLGMTPDEYGKELIVEDAQLDELASKKSFSELAMPFKKALAHMSESDLDDLAKPHKRKAKR